MATKALQLPEELHGQTVISVRSFDELYRFAQVCQASGLFADTTDVAQAFVKICKGAEMGLPPTTAMSAFDLIQKRLFIKPWVIAAKINACGYGSYHVVEHSAQRCTIQFLKKYPTRGWVELIPISYTLEEATAHGLVQRSPHWKASPAHMLYQRCMGRGGAMYFPELLGGIDPPPDDTPISAAQHQDNIEALYGEGMNPTLPNTPDAGSKTLTAEAPQPGAGHESAGQPGLWSATDEVQSAAADRELAEREAAQRIANDQA
jgi:hypothetical protein